MYLWGKGKGRNRGNEGGYARKFGIHFWQGLHGDVICPSHVMSLTSLSMWQDKRDFVDVINGRRGAQAKPSIPSRSMGEAGSSHGPPPSSKDPHPGRKSPAWKTAASSAHETRRSFMQVRVQRFRTRILSPSCTVNTTQTLDTRSSLAPRIAFTLPSFVWSPTVKLSCSFLTT